MLNVVNTILPVFVIILLGWGLKRAGKLPGDLIGPLNRLVYYLAIPAMIFREVANTAIQEHFKLLMLFDTLVPVFIVFLAACFLARFIEPYDGKPGTFVQSSLHGNLGYIGLAVSYYFLGETGFSQASILAGFLMLLQNLLSVIGLQALAVNRKTRPGFLSLAGKIVGNPVIVSALGGIAFSLLNLSLPIPLDRMLKIISGMALPLALLVIGASLSFRLIRNNFRPAFTASVFKLGVLPLLGIIFYTLSGFPVQQFLPGLILLAAPTATVTYVMAGEMHGSTELASAAISLNTLLSAATYILWLGILVIF